MNQIDEIILPLSRSLALSLSLYLSIYLSIFLSLLSIYLSLSIYLYLSISLSLSLCVCVTVWYWVACMLRWVISTYGLSHSGVLSPVLNPIYVHIYIWDMIFIFIETIFERSVSLIIIVSYVWHITRWINC